MGVKKAIKKKAVTGMKLKKSLNQKTVCSALAKAMGADGLTTSEYDALGELWRLAHFAVQGEYES